MLQYDPSTAGHDVPAAAWTKASRSGGNGGACVEVAFLPDARPDGPYAALRDSKQPSAAALMFTRDEWDAFQDGVSKGEFQPS